jgi:hypothetical protein
MRARGGYYIRYIRKVTDYVLKGWGAVPREALTYALGLFTPGCDDEHVSLRVILLLTKSKTRLNEDKPWVGISIDAGYIVKGSECKRGYGPNSSRLTSTDEHIEEADLRLDLLSHRGKPEETEELKDQLFRIDF